MFKSAILLTGAVEYAHLAPVLLHHADGTLDVRHAPDGPALDAAVKDADGPILLIAYCTPVIVPEALIEAVCASGGRAYNFHPAPPTYPGVGAAQRAILDGADVFGVTAHELTVDIDGGPIVGVMHMPLPDDISGFGLEQKAYLLLFDLFENLAPALVSEDGPPQMADAAWGAQSMTRAELEELKNTSPEDAETRERHHRAFN